MKRTKILIVDDDPATLKLVQVNLKSVGYETMVAKDGIEALEIWKTWLPELVILDIMMPGMDGFEVCRRIREHSHIPIIMLSARGGSLDKVKCLNLGADDYITKPFGVDELIARVNAVLRRTGASVQAKSQPTFVKGELAVDFDKRKVTVSGNEVKLTPVEYRLLQFLILNIGKVATHQNLLYEVWGVEHKGEKEYLHVFVHRLRAKLETGASKHTYIETVPGIGYRFSD
jgi:DNA-binding response OmpR family regulator